MNTARLMLLHKEKFMQQLQSKSTWDKASVEALYYSCYFEALEQVAQEESRPHKHVTNGN